jgi:hypothetical protein
VLISAITQRKGINTKIEEFIMTTLRVRNLRIYDLFSSHVKVSSQKVIASGTFCSKVAECWL